MNRVNKPLLFLAFVAGLAIVIAGVIALTSPKPADLSYESADFGDEKDASRGEVSGLEQSAAPSQDDGNDKQHDSPNPGGDLLDRDEPEKAVQSNENSAVEESQPGNRDKQRIWVTHEKSLTVDSLRSRLEGAGEISQLAVNGAQMTPEVVELLAEFGGNIDELYIMDVFDTPDSSLDSVRSLSGVTVIRLHDSYTHKGRGKPANDFAYIFEAYGSNPDITRFETQRQFPITDGMLEAIARSRSITHLTLHCLDTVTRSTALTEVGIKALGQMAQLKELALHNFGGYAGYNPDMVTAIGEALTGLVNLERLTLPYWPITDSHFTAWLSSLARLKSLDVRGSQISDAAWATVPPTWALEELLTSPGGPRRQWLNYSLGNDGAAALAKLPNLRRLETKFSKVTADGLNALAASGVRHLGIQIRKGDLHIVESFAGLESLHLSGNKSLEGDAVFRAAERSGVTTLGISELTFVTRAYLERLFNETAVKRVYVFRCPNLSQSDVDVLQSEYGHIEIIYGSPYSFNVG